MLRFVASVVWVGNPHLVVTKFVNSNAQMQDIVNAVKTCGLFPSGINVEFVTLKKREAVAVVFERGSGKTLACGSGCVAIFWVLHHLKRVGDSLVVKFDGGRLKAFIKGGESFLSGVPRYQRLEEVK